MSPQPPLTSEPTRHIAPDVPPLEAGDRLARPEFRRRYAAHPDIRRADFRERLQPPDKDSQKEP
jgi:hypothetical protein